MRNRTFPIAWAVVDQPKVASATRVLGAQCRRLCGTRCGCEYKERPRQAKASMPVVDDPRCSTTAREAIMPVLLSVWDIWRHWTRLMHLGPAVRLVLGRTHTPRASVVREDRRGFSIFVWGNPSSDTPCHRFHVILCHMVFILGALGLLSHLLRFGGLRPP